MCNYYSRTNDIDHVRDLFRVDVVPPTNYAPRVVVRPTNRELVVRRAVDGRREMVEARWGLVPHWAADEKTGYTTFNARDDKFRHASSFRDPWRRGQRCLVPVDGYIESRGPTGQKTHYFIRARDHGMLAFAGLYERWPGPAGAPPAEPLISYTILTTTGDKTVAPFHDRMPVLLTTDEARGLWVGGGGPSEPLEALIRPTPMTELVVNEASPDLLRMKDFRPTQAHLEGAI